MGVGLLLKIMVLTSKHGNAALKKLQDENRMTELMAEQEAVKTLPFGDIWNEYCRRCGVVSDREFYGEIRKYEGEVQLKR